MNEDELVNIYSSSSAGNDPYASTQSHQQVKYNNKFNQTQYGVNVQGFQTNATTNTLMGTNTNTNMLGMGTDFLNNTDNLQFNGNKMIKGGLGINTGFANNGYGVDFGKGSFLNDISIEGVDENGRVTLKSLQGRDSTASLGGLKWKRKSELSKSIISSGKSRISIKGNNQYEYIYCDNDPFNQSSGPSQLMQNSSSSKDNSTQNNNSSGGKPPQFQLAENVGVGGFNTGNFPSVQNSISRPSLKLGNTSEQRMSRISQIIQQRNSIGAGKQPIYSDFIPENDEEDIGDEMEAENFRKFSIRALNFNMMSKLSPAQPQHTLLARASSKLLSTSHRNNGRGTISSRRTINNNGSQQQYRKTSRISKAPNYLMTPGRDSELMYNVDDGSMDEETDFATSHRFSIVKRYNIPTFFTPDKSLSDRMQQINLSAQKMSAQTAGRILNNNGVNDKQGMSPQVQMIDQLNVNQPGLIRDGSQFPGNETIIEETNEADESILQYQRFSQGGNPINVDGNILNDDFYNDFSQEQNQFLNYQGRVSQGQQKQNQNFQYQQQQLEINQITQPYDQVNTVINNKLTHSTLQEDDYAQQQTNYLNQQYQQIQQIQQQQQQQIQQQQFIQQQQQQQSKNQKSKGGNKLDAFVTKVPMPGQQNVANIQKQDSTNSAVFEKQMSNISDTQQNDMNTVMHQDSLAQNQDDQNQQEVTDESGNNGQDLHKVHFFQTLQALQFIRNNLRVVEFEEIKDQVIYLPDPKRPELTKVLIFDMDETLIHCVDDVETDDPDVVLEIDFPDEETVYAGINIRPYVMECLEEANQHFQVIVFTASHQTYADAILDYLDPNHELIQYRMYRQHCILTKEGYYVKDLRVIGNRDLKDLVIVDNSVYSFAFQIDNGIPIIPFYKDPNDEEMLHLIYYLNCLANVEDVRQQNRAAFELYKLGNGDQQQQSDDQQDQDQLQECGPLDQPDELLQGYVDGEYDDEDQDSYQQRQQQQQDQYSDDYNASSSNSNRYYADQQNYSANSRGTNSNNVIMEMSRESSVGAPKYYGNSKQNSNTKGIYNFNEVSLNSQYNQSPNGMINMNKQASQADSLYNEDIQNINQRFNNL